MLRSEAFPSQDLVPRGELQPRRIFVYVDIPAMTDFQHAFVFLATGDLFDIPGDCVGRGSVPGRVWLRDVQAPASGQGAQEGSSSG